MLRALLTHYRTLELFTAHILVEREALYLIQKTLVETVKLIEGYRLAHVTTLT